MEKAFALSLIHIFVTCSYEWESARTVVVAAEVR